MKHPVLSSLVLLLFSTVIACYVGYVATPEKWNSNLQTCHRLTQGEILRLLPEDAYEYDSSDSAYSPDDCYYALDALLSDRFLLNAKYPDASIVGIWVIDVRAHRATHLPMNQLGSFYDETFKEWVTNTQFAIISVNNESLELYDVTSHTIVKKQLLNIVFRFVALREDVTVTPHPPATQAVDPSCYLSRTTLQGFYSYPMSCLQKSLATLQVPGYPHGVTLQYIDPFDVLVNGSDTRFSASSYTEIDL